MSATGRLRHAMDLFLPLPFELVLHVITCSLPAPDVLLRPTHPTTKLLLSFTLVCHETRSLANQYLRKHCTVLLSQSQLSSFLLTIPKVQSLCTISSLGLAPFATDIDDLPLCSWVRALLLHTCETLTKLIIDIPLRTCYPADDDLAVRPVLRDGFTRLVNLREFVSVRDELYLDTTEDRSEVPVWTLWPKLRRLALYNMLANEEFWLHVGRHGSLEAIVLTHPDCVDEIDPKLEYRKHTNRPLKVLVVVPGSFSVFPAEYADTAKWPQPDPVMKLSIHRPTDLPRVRGFYQDVKPHVMKAALDSSLWDWQGE